MFELNNSLHANAKRFGAELRWQRKYLCRKRNLLLVKQIWTKEKNNEMLGLE